MTYADTMRRLLLPRCACTSAIKCHVEYLLGAGYTARLRMQAQVPVFLKHEHGQFA